MQLFKVVGFITVRYAWKLLKYKFNNNFKILIEHKYSHEIHISGSRKKWDKLGLNGSTKSQKAQKEDNIEDNEEQHEVEEEKDSEQEQKDEVNTESKIQKDSNNKTRKFKKSHKHQDNEEQLKMQQEGNLQQQQQQEKKVESESKILKDEVKNNGKKKRRKAPTEALFLAKNLALAPAGMVRENLKIIEEVINRDAQEWPVVRIFLKYLMDEWCTKIQIVSNFGSPGRTNNRAETFNRPLLKRIGGKNPPFMQFLCKLFFILIFSLLKKIIKKLNF